MGTQLPAGYRPSESESFMNERQREYFRRKLNSWKDDILREAARRSRICRPRPYRMPISPIVPRPRPNASSNCARATASAN